MSTSKPKPRLPRRPFPIITDIDPDGGPLNTTSYGWDGVEHSAPVIGRPKRQPRQSKDAYIRQLEDEVIRLRHELRTATEPRRTPGGGIQFPFGPTTGPLMRARG